MNFKIKIKIIIILNDKFNKFKINSKMYRIIFLIFKCILIISDIYLTVSFSNFLCNTNMSYKYLFYLFKIFNILTIYLRVIYSDMFSRSLRLYFGALLLSTHIISINNIASTINTNIDPIQYYKAITKNNNYDNFTINIMIIVIDDLIDIVLSEYN